MMGVTLGRREGRSGGGNGRGGEGRGVGGGACLVKDSDA